MKKKVCIIITILSSIVLVVSIFFNTKVLAITEESNLRYKGDGKVILIMKELKKRELKLYILNQVKE